MKVNFGSVNRFETGDFLPTTQFLETRDSEPSDALELMYFMASYWASLCEAWALEAICVHHRLFTPQGPPPRASRQRDIFLRTLTLDKHMCALHMGITFLIGKPKPRLHPQSIEPLESSEHLHLPSLSTSPASFRSSQASASRASVKSKPAFFNKKLERI